MYITDDAKKTNQSFQQKCITSVTQGILGKSIYDY